MKSIIKAIFVLPVVGVIIVILAQGQSSNRSSNSKASSEQTTAEVRLQYLGKKYDKFFTIEGVMKEQVGTAESESPIEYKLIDKPIDKPTLDEDLKEIHRLLPQFTYWINKQNPRLIHVMDARLSGNAHYALEQTVEHFEFEGRLVQLVGEIGKHNVAVFRPPGFFTPYQPNGEGKVKIKARNIKIRDILSNYIDLNNRIGRIIWKATTYRENKKTYVEFSGLIDKSKQPAK
jgi:hypothetical protein